MKSSSPRLIIGLTVITILGLLLFILSIYGLDSSISKDSESVLSLELIFLKSTGTFGSESGQFDRPHGMDFFNNQLFVLDTGNNRIQIFSEDMNLISIIPINTNEPQGISVTNEKIFVADTYDYKIKSFDHNGTFLNQFGVSWTRDLEADENYEMKIKMNRLTLNY